MPGGGGKPFGNESQLQKDCCHVYRREGDSNVARLDINPPLSLLLAEKTDIWRKE